MNEGRPGGRSTPKGIAQKAALTRAFLVRKMEEYEALKEEIDSLNSGIEASVEAPKR